MEIQAGAAGTITCQTRRLAGERAVGTSTPRSDGH
jgi:NADPH-dependent curcumin reductase CurA